MASISKSRPDLAPPRFASGLASFTITVKANKASGKLTLLAEVVRSAGWEGWLDDRVLAEYVDDGHLRLHRASAPPADVAMGGDETDDDLQVMADLYQEAPVYRGESTRVVMKAELVSLFIAEPTEFKDKFLFLQARTNAIDVLTNRARHRRNRAARGGR